MACITTKDDSNFGAMGSAWQYHWTGSGVCHPPQTDALLCKTLKWAISSSFATEPSLNVVFATCSPDSGAMRLASHSRVFHLCTFHPRALSLQHPMQWQTIERMRMCSSAHPTHVFVVANLLGLRAFAHNDRLETLRSHLDQHYPTTCTFHHCPSMPLTRPGFGVLGSCPVLSKEFHGATVPAAVPAGQGPHTYPVLPAVCSTTRVLRFAGRDVVYTYGSLVWEPESITRKPMVSTVFKLHATLVSITLH